MSELFKDMLGIAESMKESSDRIFVLNGQCPKCKGNLNHFSGVEHYPSGLYCPKCNDSLYAELSGEFIMAIE